MNLTLAGRIVLFLASFALILALVEVAARVWAGQWDAEKVVAVVAAVPTIVLIALMWWRWEA